MNVVRRIRYAAYGLMVFVLVTIGAGVGLTLWLGSWHDRFVDAAGESGALEDPGLTALMTRLDSVGTTMTIVLAALAFAALAFGAASVVVLRRRLEGQVVSALRDMGGSALQLQTVASQMSAAIAQTAGATSETTATVEEVRQTALLAQEKAEDTQRLAEEVLGAFTYGAESARENVAKFQEIRDDVGVVVEAIDRLKEQANSVRDIIATVNDLAEQSNLLSVNASIEAAKAGDHGKGFTVVAQEVKSLATQSKQAVGQVHMILAEIERASAMAESSTDKAWKAVESGRVTAEQAAEAVSGHLDVANLATDAAVQIAATSRQQLNGMEQITRAITSINEAGNQSVDGMRQVEREADGLQKLSRRLKGMFDVYRHEVEPATSRVAST